MPSMTTCPATCATTQSPDHRSAQVLPGGPTNTNLLAPPDPTPATEVGLTMQLKSYKMNNLSLDDLPQRVGDMHIILLGISRELANIKQIMAVEKEDPEKNGLKKLRGRGRRGRGRS